jgi:hypothetical protein
MKTPTKNTPATRRRKTKSAIWQTEFIAQLETGATVTAAALHVRVTRQAVYAAQLKSPGFKAECHRAFDVGTKVLVYKSQTGRTQMEREAASILATYRTADFDNEGPANE